MPPTDRPRLRPHLGAAPEDSSGQVFRVFDTLRLSDAVLRVSALELEWLQLFNGRRSLRDVQAEARSLLLEALRLDPRMVAALVALGKLSRWCGLPAEARAYLERALEVEPGNRQAKAEIAQLGTAPLKVPDAT